MLSGNRVGINILNGSQGNLVAGNLIGYSADKVTPLGNQGDGIRIYDGSNNIIGGSPARANAIAFNSGAGVLVNNGTGNLISCNSISSNSQLGIDLIASGAFGVTPNDPGDADTGANNLQNYPMLSRAALLSNGLTYISGTLNSTANTKFHIELFANNTPDQRGYGPGQFFLGSFDVTTDANGNASFLNAWLGVRVGQSISATAIDPANNTSEFSKDLQVVADGPGSLQFTSTAYSVSENGGQAAITVKRSGGSFGTVTVQYATVAGGTATAGSDYTTVSGTITWGDFDSSDKTFTVPIIDHSVTGPDKTVNLVLSNPTNGAALGSPHTAVLTIKDNDPLPQLSINDVSQAEGNAGTTNFTFTVSLSAASSQSVTVNYATQDGSAQSGSDYQAASGMLTFNAGETAKTITVLVNGDTQVEPDETFTVQLSNAVNATINKAQGTGTIVNDDTAQQPSTMQFDSASYTVNESAHFTQVTVTRTGDTSQSASVDYQTMDGSAHQQSDYTLALGTLRFAAGEASKTVTLLITDDSYVEGDETFTITLSNPSGVSLGAQSVAQVTITDNDSNAAAPNAIDDVPNFVRQHYHDFLNREPEPGGFQGWQDVLNNCAAGDPTCDRIEVSADFYRSQEFHDRGYFIYRFYSASLGRIPKYLEFMRDMQQVSGFLTAQQEEQAKVDFIQEFISRSEFQQKYSQITDAGQFVDAILSTAGVTSPQRDQIVAQLQTNQITRGQALRAIVESAEVDQHFYNEAFVIMQYFGYLRRDADALYLNWLATLNLTHDYRVLVNGFVNSLEYCQRFGN